MSIEKSFTQYRNKSDDNSTSDEDEIVSKSFIEDSAEEETSEDDSNSNKSVTIGETDTDDGEDSFVIRKSHKKNKNKKIISSDESNVEDSDNDNKKRKINRRASQRPKNQDTSSQSQSNSSGFSKGEETESAVYSSNNETDDDNDDYIEKQTFSPRTRQSIGGYCPSDLSSDDDDDDDDQEDTTVSSRNLSPNDNNDEINDYKNNIAGAKNSTPTKSKSVGKNVTQNDETIFTDEDEELHSFNPESVAPSKIESSIQMKMDQTGINFNKSIVNKMSSTLFGNSPANLSIVQKTAAAADTNENSGSVISIKDKDIIEISSSPNNSSVEMSTPILTRNIVQPPKFNKIIPSTPKSSKSEIKVVSKEYYEKELRKIEDIKSEIVVCENLIGTLGSRLPDQGKRMSGRLERLKMDIKKQAELVSTLVVEEDNGKKNATKIAGLNQNVPKWSELSAAVNDIQPVHTGKTGLATFNTQKALTIDRLKDIHGSLETCPTENVFAEQPKGLKVTLMDHQRHALAWMNWRERQKPKGGILADDMGLGKTLTMISLVLDTKQKEEDMSSDSESDENNGNDREWKGKGRKDFYNGGTVVIGPASLIRQWESEIEKHTKRNLMSVCVYHGNNRETKPRLLSKYDIVLTSYNIISREAKTLGPVFGVKWKRIILDEAHIIRNHKSLSSEAVCNLRGTCRWALTGTPVQNKEMDLYAILKFLRCSPFDDLGHWKRWIDNKSAGGKQRLNTLMKSLMLRRTKVQLQENGSLQGLPEKQSSLIEVNLDKAEMNVYQKIMIYSRTLFAQFLYQRAEKNHDLDILPSGRSIQPPTDPNGAFFKMHQKFAKLHHGGKEIKSHQILVLLLRLRQICCHPGLIDSMLEDEENISQSDNSGNSHPEIDLLQQLNNLKINEDGATGGNSIEGDSLTSSKDEAIYRASSKVLLKSNPVFDYNRPSTKMRKIFDVLEEKILKSNDKAIIVSQWTSYLDIIKNHLCRKRIPILSLNGSVPVHKRQQIVSDFNDSNNKSKVLLLSLTAGGVGLNLVGANHLFLIDLHWNPQLESQAQDRIYRVGQKKPVHIYKFMCKETIEERIKGLQDQKLEVANGVLTGAKVATGSKLTLDDLRCLFGL